MCLYKTSWNLIERKEIFTKHIISFCVSMTIVWNLTNWLWNLWVYQLPFLLFISTVMKFCSAVSNLSCMCVIVFESFPQQRWPFLCVCEYLRLECTPRHHGLIIVTNCPIYPLLTKITVYCANNHSLTHAQIKCDPTSGFWAFDRRFWQVHKMGPQI
jgi:hypothetical protein